MTFATEGSPICGGVCDQKRNPNRRPGGFLGTVVQIWKCAFLFKWNLEPGKWRHSKEPESLRISSSKTSDDASWIVAKWIAAWKYFGQPRRKMHSPEPTGQTAGVSRTWWLWMWWKTVALRSLPVVKSANVTCIEPKSCPIVAGKVSPWNEIWQTLIFKKIAILIFLRNL